MAHKPAVQYMPANQDGMPMEVVTQVPQTQAAEVDDPMPRDHIIWSMFQLMYCNPLCLGFVAFIYSIKSRDRKMAGDYAGARSYASTARWLNIVAIVITLISTAVVLSQIYTIIRAVVQFIQSIGQH